MRRVLLASVFLPLVVLVGCDVEGTVPGDVDPTSQAEEQIINGSNDTADATHNAIVYLEGNMGACTGTIISTNGSTGYVLTAGHCNGMDVMGIGSNLNSAVGYNITDLGAHPNWNGDAGNGYDFRMYSFVGANASTPVIPVATTQEYAIGSMATVAGWGLTIDGDNGSSPTIRQQVTKPINDIFSNPPLIKYIQTNSGFCSGDSGGPSLFNGKLIAVTSFTSGNNGSCIDPGFVGRVDHPTVASWIAQVVGGQVVQTCDTCFQSVVAQGGACAGVVDTCINNQDCSDLLTCFDGCTTNACYQDCANAHPTGTNLYLDIIDCACTSCSTLCANDPSCASSSTTTTTTTTTTTGAGGSTANGTGGGAANGSGGATANGSGGASSADGSGGAGGDGDTGGTSCNCSTVGGDSDSGLVGLGAMVLGLGVVASRRRRSA